MRQQYNATAQHDKFKCYGKQFANNPAKTGSTCNSFSSEHF